MSLRQEQIITALFFVLQFVVVSSVTHYCENGNTVTITGETTGVIKTLVSGTSQYGNNLNCGWVINGGTGNRIQMLIGGVDLQSAPVYTSCGGYDNLSIKDGDSDSSREITSICGERNPYEVIGSGQYVYLKFYSNDKNFYDHSGITVTFNVFNKTDCPPNWNTLSTTDQCYRIRQNPSSGVNWFSAYHNCLYSQANLAIVDQHQVFDNLQAHSQSLAVSSAWIALTDIKTEGTLTWLNNENLASWIRTEGNIDDYDCAIFDFNTQKFKIKDCKNEKHFSVCQRDRSGNKSAIYTLPEEGDETKPDTFSLRWMVILGVGAGVIVIIILFVLYVKFRKSKPTVPSSSEGISTTHSTRYRPTNTPNSSTDSNESRRQMRNESNRNTPPPSYSDISRNNPNTIQFNPQINVNFNVNTNRDTNERPPSYSFYAPMA